MDTTLIKKYIKKLTNAALVTSAYNERSKQYSTIFKVAAGDVIRSSLLPYALRPWARLRQRGTKKRFTDAGLYVQFEITKTV